MSVNSLSNRHAKVLREILEHRTPANLEWHDVLRLTEELGSVRERHDGKYEFRIGNAEAVFTKPHDKDITVDELAQLRRFLKEAGVSETGVQPQQKDVAQPQGYIALVVDRLSARFFKPDLENGRPVEFAHVQSSDPNRFLRDKEQSKHVDKKSEHTPDASEYYERIAERLKGTEPIIILTDAKGKAGALTYLNEHLAKRHKDILNRVIATEDIDPRRLKAGEIKQFAERHLKH